MGKIDEMTATNTEAPAPPANPVKGRTTEQVVEALLADREQDPWPIIEALGARFAARAAKRAAKEE